MSLVLAEIVQLIERRVRNRKVADSTGLVVVFLEKTTFISFLALLSTCCGGQASRKTCKSKP